MKTIHYMFFIPLLIWILLAIAQLNNNKHTDILMTKHEHSMCDYRDELLTQRKWLINNGIIQHKHVNGGG